MIKCVGKDHDYEFNAQTKISVYKKEPGWSMLSTLGSTPRKYLKSSLPRLVEIQLMNAVLLHYGKELHEDGDPKEVLQLVADERIEYKSTPTNHPGSDVPREQVDVMMKHLDKVQDQPDSSYNLDSVHGMAKLRSIYMDYCIPQFMNYEGFGSRGRKAFLDVVAARLTQQYVLGTKEKAVRTGYLPQWFGAAQLSFMTFLKKDWWPLFQVLARGPYTTFELEQRERNESHSHHVVQL